MVRVLHKTGPSGARTEWETRDRPGAFPELLPLGITAVGDAITLTAFGAMGAPGGPLLVEITAVAEYSAYDHLGSVRVVISSTGARLNTLATRPFAICAYGCGSEPKYAYTGEYRESSTNLLYLHSRWYDPTIGRFLSPDDRLGRLTDGHTATASGCT